MPERLNLPDALVLAGGFGTRLKTVLPDQPKVLATVAGRPFIFYLLEQLHRAGIRRAILCTGYKADEVAGTVGRAYKSMAIGYSRETMPLGTGGALRLALEQVASKRVLAMNGDSYIDTDLRPFIDWSAACRGVGALIAVRVENTARFGTLRIDVDGRVTAFDEKQTRAAAGHINAGVYLLAQKVLQAIPPGLARSLEYDVFPGLLADGLYAWARADRFIDIGTPTSYRQANDFFADFTGDAEMLQEGQKRKGAVC